jgi:hypothetical protein
MNSCDQMTLYHMPKGSDIETAVNNALVSVDTFILCVL